MEKRLILFLILSFLVMFFYPYLTKKLGYQPGNEKTSKAPTLISPTVEGSKGPDLLTHLPTPLVDAGEVTVETDLLTVKLSMRGGVIKSWELKKYYLSSHDLKEPVQLVHQGKDSIYPLTLLPAGPLQNPPSELFTPSAGRLVVDKQNPTASLTLDYSNPTAGVQIQKKLTFHQGSYGINLEIQTRGIQQAQTLFLGTNFGIAEWGKAAGGFAGFIGPTHLIDGKIVKDDPKKLLQPVVHSGPVLWSALQDKYFLAAFIPQEGPNQVLVKSLGEEQGHPEITIGIQDVVSADKSAARLLLYAGPKEYDALRALDVHLEETIDFGWFIYGSWVLVRVVAQPLFDVLRFFHQYTYNYGIAIILLTVVVRILFIPLTHKSYKSMKAMQAIQPKVAALQKKYKDNKEQLNREMLELYRQHKVNPFGGCLPSLLQLPVFVALFNVLYTTIDLRQAPFALWIRDLSDKDPYYVLPILMGVTMMAQQKLQPSQMDPRQARLMLLMPAFMTILFLSFPAGLVLYWMTSNLLSIGQQAVTMKYFERTAHEPVQQ